MTPSPPLLTALRALVIGAVCTLAPFARATAQAEQVPLDKPAFEYKPLQLNLDTSGFRYVRFILWHQQWLETNNLSADDTDLRLSTYIRRSRILAYAQMSPRVLFLTHFGLNSLTAENLSSLGNNGDAPQLFLHGAWVEFKASEGEELYVGTGLHYWKGLTRLASASTLNFMTLDQPRPFAPWHSLAVSDQFARHLGVYAKGILGKLDYRIAVNQAGANGIARDFSTSARTDSLAYTGPGGNPDAGRWLAEGYFSYALGDQESIKLPYRVGSYLGAKRIINVGAGFFLHPNGVSNYGSDATLGDDVTVGHFAADLFVDMPLTTGDCLNAYLAYTRFDYGDNFVSRWAGTGNNVLGQVGYKPPGSKFMPYLAAQFGDYEGFEDNVIGFDAGVNYFIAGHNTKLTLEFHSIANDPREGGFDANGDVQDLAQLRAQAHVFF